MEAKAPGTQSVKDREMLYRLIVGQLRYDGYETVASNLFSAISSYPPTAPSSRLSHLVQLGMQAEGESTSNPEVTLPHIRGQGVMDLEFESDEVIAAPSVHKYELNYVTSHKGRTLVSTFSRDGKLVASGSADSTIKILDTERMTSCSSMGQQDLYPVLRTLYDHSEAVLALDFHPSVSVLASGSRDCTVKFFDYSKPATKRSYRALREVAGVRSLVFHPSGDFMLVGTEQCTLRLYDVNTFQCFVSSDSRDQHGGAITSVHYSADGRAYTTGSKDGTIKIWDGISNRCVNTLKEAHGKEPVCSVRFSKNTKYILSAGKDSNAVLWELSTGRPLNTYQPPKQGNLQHRTNAVFNHTEDYVLMADEKAPQPVLLCWESRTTQPSKSLFTGHQAPIRWVEHSPNTASFVTCGEDGKVRFFVNKEQYL